MVSLNEFDQDAAGGFGMEEGDLRAARPRPRRRLDDAIPGLARPGQGGVNIRHAPGKMVKSRSFRNRTVEQVSSFGSRGAINSTCIPPIAGVPAKKAVRTFSDGTSSVRSRGRPSTSE